MTPTPARGRRPRGRRGRRASVGGVARSRSIAAAISARSVTRTDSWSVACRPCSRARSSSRSVRAAARGLGRRGELAEHQQRGDAVLVADVLGVAAVAQRLLVAERQARHPGDPLEAGERLLVRLPCGRGQLAEQRRRHDRAGVDARCAARDAGGAPSRAPTSSPRSIRHPCGPGTAAAQRSASGSLATTMSAPRSDGERHREVHRAGLLGVREGDGGEVGVGLLLLRRRRGRGEAGRLQHLQHRRAADAVQRGVDDVEVARAVGGERRRRCRVAVDDRPRRAPCRDRRAGRRRPRRPRRCARRSRCRQAARSGCRRRGRPCSRCPGAGCGSRSPSRRRRSRARGSRRPAAASAAAAAAAAPENPAPLITSAVSRGEDVGVVAGVVPDHHGLPAGEPCRGGTPPGRPRRGGRRRGSSGSARRRARRGARRCRTPASRRTGRPGRRRRRRPRPSAMIASSSARVPSSGSSAAQARARSSSRASSPSSIRAPYRPSGRAVAGQDDGVTGLPRPRDLDAPVAELVRELAGHLGDRRHRRPCASTLLAGADRRDHLDVLRYLTGHAFAAGRRDPRPRRLEGLLGPHLGCPRAPPCLGRHRRPQRGGRRARRRGVAAGRDVPEGGHPPRGRGRRRRGGRASSTTSCRGSARQAMRTLAVGRRHRARRAGRGARSTTRRPTYAARPARALESMRERLDLRERAVSAVYSFRDRWHLAAPPARCSGAGRPRALPGVVAAGRAVAKLATTTPGCCAVRRCPTPSTWCCTPVRDGRDLLECRSRATSTASVRFAARAGGGGHPARLRAGRHRRRAARRCRRLLRPRPGVEPRADDGRLPRWPGPTAARELGGGAPG